MTTLRAKPHIRIRNGQRIVEYRVPPSLGLKDFATLYPLGGYSGPYSGWIDEPFPGAWQSNQSTISRENVLKSSPVFACTSLISGDISKLRPMLMRAMGDGTRREITDGSNFLAVLARPNSYQTWQQFCEEWLISKLAHGNAYVLKEYDNRGGREQGMVRAMYVLHPMSVEVLVSEDGEVFYRIRRDDLAGIPEPGMIFAAEDIIHDREMTLFHPLIGVSPLFAAAMSATQGTKAQVNMQALFGNQSRPGLVITAPKRIDKDQAREIKARIETGYSGENIGKTLVLGDDMKATPIGVNPVDAQIVEQLGWTVGDVARAFLVPPYKLGLTASATYSNAGQMDLDYYKQCLQKRIRAVQVLLTQGLGVPSDMRVWLDLSDLQLLDPEGRAKVRKERITAGELSPNEARLEENLPPVEGGESPMLQQQMYSLAALAKRDAKDDPFEKAPTGFDAAQPAKDAEAATLARCAVVMQKHFPLELEAA